MRILREPTPVFLGRHDAELGCWIGKVKYPVHVSSVIHVEPSRNGVFVHKRMLQKKSLPVIMTHQTHFMSSEKARAERSTHLEDENHGGSQNFKLHAQC